MKVTATVGSVSIELYADVLDTLVSDLPDSAEYTTFYDALATHPASAVRGSVAGKENISPETILLLAQDPVPEVRRTVVGSMGGREHLTGPMLRALAEGDLECAETIASNLGSYQHESEDLAVMLAEHSDPKVRRSAASNSSTPRRLLKKLSKDPDAGVREGTRYSM